MLIKDFSLYTEQRKDLYVIMIEFKNVRSIYKRNNHVALDGVSFKIEDGEFVFIVGHSGAGKTTMTKLLLREMTPTSGSIIVNNYNLKKLTKFMVAKYG